MWVTHMASSITREQALDEAVRRVKGGRKWDLSLERYGVVETPWRGNNDPLFPQICAEFRRILAEAA